MSCYNCGLSIDEPSYKYIYCLINTKTKAKNYFLQTDRLDFAFDFDFLKIEVIRVLETSDEYNTAVINSSKLDTGFYLTVRRETRSIS